tara:strand:- start:1192 stop:2058 length:867 start_codon:yes stop_codon:yes gene_type:complete
MDFLSKINRNRNEKILVQAKELNSLLLSNNIRPLFLKGTGNLLAGLYEDIAERLVGDIDILISKEDYPKAIRLLRDSGYSELENQEYFFPETKHYRRLQKKNSIAAVEIHKELIIDKYTSEFNYNFVDKDCQVIRDFALLSYANKLNLTIIANQINDSGFYYKTLALRNAYDVFLLSKKTNAKNAVNNLDKLIHPLNCFLAACYEAFNKIDSLEYNVTNKVNSYLIVFNSQFTNIKRTKRRHKLVNFYLFLKARLNIICKCFFYKDYRLWVFKRLTDKKWYKEKLFKF